MSATYSAAKPKDPVIRRLLDHATIGICIRRKIMNRDYKTDERGQYIDVTLNEKEFRLYIKELK